MQLSPPEPNSGLRIELFGGFNATLDGIELSHFRTRKTAALLAYLAFNSDRAHTRDVLVELFWPESHLDSGRQSLRMALSALRETLGPTANDYLSADRQAVRLYNVRTDVAEFEEWGNSSDHATLNKAMRLVRGPLMQGYDESWIVAQWLRIEEAYAQTAVKLMTTASSTEEFNTAILAGKEAVSILGPREDVHLALVKLYSQVGNTTQAIAQFEELERQLDEHWGESPSDDAYQVLNSLPKSEIQKPHKRHTPAPIPTRTSSFFGRDQECAEIQDLLINGSNRLVTILGPGGSGKTAITHVVAKLISEKIQVPIFFVELADLREPDRVAGKIIESITGNPDKTGINELITAIGDQNTYLILDNFEQLLPAGARIVKEILSSIPNCRILATSRQALLIDGEQIYSLNPLPIPSKVLPIPELIHVPSVALFVDRASSHRAGFKLSPENAVAIIEICRRLEGLPLALELAAAKTLTHTPAQILANLGRSMEYLVSGKTDSSDRHRSLRATLDWSLKLLGQDLGDTFAVLGVFRGGFSLESAIAVTENPNFDESLAMFINSSLVGSQELESGMRFRLLEPIREFALSKLDPKQAIRTKLRHFAYFLDLASGKIISPAKANNPEWLDAMNLENENLCAAFECVFDGTISLKQATELAIAVRPFARPRSRATVWRENLLQLKSLLIQAGDIDGIAKVSINYAEISSNVNDATVTREMFVEAEKYCLEANYESGLAQAYAGIAGTYKASGQYQESIELYDKALSLFEKQEDWNKLAATTRQKAMSYVSMVDHDQCFATLLKALEYARKGDDVDALAWTLTDVGAEQAVHGLLEESDASFREAHAICRKTGNGHMQSIVYWQQAEAELRTNRLKQSAETHKKCVEMALKSDFREGLKWLMVSYGCALVGIGDAEFGLQVLSRVTAWREAEKRGFTGDEDEIMDVAKEKARKALGAQYDDIWQKAQEADLDEMIQKLH